MTIFIQKNYHLCSGKMNADIVLFQTLQMMATGGCHGFLKE